MPLVEVRIAGEGRRVGWEAGATHRADRGKCIFAATGTNSQPSMTTEKVLLAVKRRNFA
jgi:hypothetical protein